MSMEESQGSVWRLCTSRSQTAPISHLKVSTESQSKPFIVNTLYRWISHTQISSWGQKRWNLKNFLLNTMLSGNLARSNFLKVIQYSELFSSKMGLLNSPLYRVLTVFVSIFTYFFYWLILVLFTESTNSANTVRTSRSSDLFSVTWLYSVLIEAGADPWILVHGRPIHTFWGRQGMSSRSIKGLRADFELAASSRSPRRVLKRP